MPSLSKHQSNIVTKVLILGDAKSGKTTSLVSLVEAGYKLRILDMDNLLDPLKEQILAKCPDKIDNVEFRTLRDKRKATALGPVIEGKPRAFVEAVKMIDHWKYTDHDGVETDLGRPTEWGTDCILVLDSLSRFCDAAYDFRDSIAVVGKFTGEKEGRAIYGDAQDAVESSLAHLTSSSFTVNTIVICHGQYMDLPDGTKKIFPQGVGQKLSPKIPQYFPVYVRLVNKAGKRTIELESNVMIDLAFPKPDTLKGLSTDDGLRKIFETLRSVPSSDAPAPAKPKSLTIRRV
jgi:AAA domain